MLRIGEIRSRFGAHEFCEQRSALAAICDLDREMGRDCSGKRPFFVKRPLIGGGINNLLISLWGNVEKNFDKVERNGEFWGSFSQVTLKIL